MKKLAIAAVVVLALALGAGLIAPSLVDWGPYRQEIARQVESATGRPVTFDGPIELALLPVPRLRALGVSLAAPQGASTRELMRAREFELLLNWGPLFAGRLEVASLRLVEPELWFEVLADGRNAWMLPNAVSSASERPQGEGPPLRLARLEQVSVSGGRVFYRNARTGAAETIDRIDGELTGDALEGPMRAIGNATLRGERVRFDLALGDLTPARPAPVALTLTLDAARATYRGTLIRGEGGARIQGRVQGEAASLAPWLASIGITIEEGDGAWAALAARPISLAGQMTLGGDGLAVNDLAIELGDLRAGAAATIAFAAVPAIDVALAIGRVDLDRLAGERAASARNARPRPTPTSLPNLPRGVEINLDLTIEALSAGQAVIRQTRLNAALNRGSLVVTSLAAQLPGDTEISAFGQIGADQRLDGVLELNANNLRALLDWLGFDLRAIPAQRLRRLEAGARIEGTMTLPEIAAIDARFDNSRLTGGIAIGRGARPAFGIDLSLDQLNLDAYRQPGGSIAGFLALPVFAAFDANLRLALDRMIVGGEAIEGLTLDGTLRDGALDLRALEIKNLVGAEVSMRGRAGAMGRAPELDMEWNARARDGARVMTLMGFDAAPGGALTAGGGLRGSIGGRMNLADLAFDGAAMRARGGVTIDFTQDPPPWQARIEADTVDLDLLARVETPTTARASPRPASSTPWPQTPLDLSRFLQGRGELALTAKRLVAFGMTMDDARLDAIVGREALDVRALTAGLHGGRLALSGRLATPSAPVLATRGTLSGAAIERVLAGALGVSLGGAADLTFDLSASGGDVATMMQALSGNLALAMRGARLAGHDLPAAVRLLESNEAIADIAALSAAAVGTGATPIDVVTGTLTLRNGVATSEDISLISRDGQASLRGRVDLARWTSDLALVIDLGKGADAPSLAVKATGPLDQPRLDVDSGELRAYLARRAANQGAEAPTGR